MFGGFKSRARLMKIKKSEWIAIIISMIILQMLFLWAIDISVSAMLRGGTLTNGISFSNPTVVYHMSLYCTIINLALFSFIAVHFIFLESKKE